MNLHTFLNSFHYLNRIIADHVLNSFHSYRPYSVFTNILAERNSEYSHDINAKGKINFKIANHMRYSSEMNIYDEHLDK